jgi:hypothetical protein
MYSLFFGGFLMTIHLSTANDVQEFISMASTLPYIVWVDDGEHCVDSRSVLQMFALDFHKPLRLQVDEAHRDDFRALAQKFLTA